MNRPILFKWLIGLGLGMLALGVWQWPDGHYRIIACDVGQGDATLITQGTTQILVDGGRKAEAVLACLGRHMPFWDRRVELVVATHPEQDHIGGLPEVIRRYQVEAVLVSDAGKPTQVFNRWLTAVQESGARLAVADAGMRLNAGRIAIKVFWPEREEARVRQWLPTMAFADQTGSAGEKTAQGEVNDRSVVLLADLDGKQVLLTGDITTEVEKELVKRGVGGRVDWLKVAHHGSKSSTSRLFLDAVKPVSAWISVGKDNRYGHPHTLVIDGLRERGTRIWRTDEAGELIFRR